MPEIGFATKAIIVKDGAFLVIKKSGDEDINPNTFDIPGGRLEFGEMPDECLRREIREEVNLEVRVVGPSRVWSFVKKEKGFQLVGATFLCEYVAGEVKLSGEHDTHEWIALDKAAERGLPAWMIAEVQAAEKIR